MCVYCQVDCGVISAACVDCSHGTEVYSKDRLGPVQLGLRSEVSSLRALARSLAALCAVELRFL